MSQSSIELATQFTIQAPSTVSAMTGVNALIAVTTTANHGLLTGDIVQLAGVVSPAGAANGQWVITKTGATTFTLNNSLGSGTWASGGTVTHVGHASATALLVDNTVFAAVPNFTLQGRLEELSTGNVRFMFEDAADSAFVTGQPTALFQASGQIGKAGPGVYAGLAGQNDKMFTAKWYDAPGTRLGASGDNLRVRVYADGGTGTTVQYSAWLTY